MIQTQAEGWDLLTSAPLAAAAAFPIGRSPLASLIAEIERAVDRRASQLGARLAAILRERVADTDLTAKISCIGSEERYVRHLLYGTDSYSLLALIWLPGQMSPVHGHRTWCVFGVHRGTLTESLFRLSEGGLQLDNCRQQRVGAVSHSSPESDAIHRIANLGVETAVSIHIYGAPFERLGHCVNRVWAD